MIGHPKGILPNAALVSTVGVAWAETEGSGTGKSAWRLVPTENEGGAMKRDEWEDPWAEQRRFAVMISRRPWSWAA